MIWIPTAEEIRNAANLSLSSREATASEWIGVARLHDAISVASALAITPDLRFPKYALPRTARKKNRNNGGVPGFEIHGESNAATPLNANGNR
jgi:hypothetical protein